MLTEYFGELLSAAASTVAGYLPAWLAGSFIGVGLAALSWLAKPQMSAALYYVITAIAFVPVTVLIPASLRLFGLNFFVYPLLALPVALGTFASCHEAFGQCNVHRSTLHINYGLHKWGYFFKVILPESMPALLTAARQTIALVFAIFIALDYFIEYWGGLGALSQHYYSRTSFDPNNWRLMWGAVFSAALMGGAQVLILHVAFRPFVQFRKHY